MGGSAFLIPGMLAEHRLEPTPIKPTLLDRIARRQRFQKPPVVDLGGGRRFIDLPATAYQVLSTDFCDFVHRCIARPWSATEAIFGYLNDNVISVYLRAEQGPEQTAPEFYVQVTFSGCAGLAEVSAELACHWVSIYYQEEQERLKNDYFYHQGFLPDDSKIQVVPGRFLPVGQLGYGLYTGMGQAEPDTEWEGSREFELDAAMADQLYEVGALETLRQLDTRFGPMMADGKCRCQLCMPDFDASQLNEFKIP